MEVNSKFLEMYQVASGDAAFVDKKTFIRSAKRLEANGLAKVIIIFFFFLRRDTENN